MRVILVFTLWLICLCYQVVGAGYKTANFVVSAPTPELAKTIGDSAEYWRVEMAVQWIGQDLPNWGHPCPINVKVSSGAGGATSFIFDKGEVYGWKMDIQGSPERLVDSVLPHEVTHTIFASYFREPLPRWADEGACTTVEHEAETSKQRRNLLHYLKTNRGIPFRQMFEMKEYPADVMPLYAQGYSVSTMLIQQHGRKKFVQFIKDGLRDDDWVRAIKDNYGYATPLDMQNQWLSWLKGNI